MAKLPGLAFLSEDRLFSKNTRIFQGSSSYGLFVVSIFVLRTMNLHLGRSQFRNTLSQKEKNCGFMIQFWCPKDGTNFWKSYEVFPGVSKSLFVKELIEHFAWALCPDQAPPQHLIICKDIIGSIFFFCIGSSIKKACKFSGSIKNGHFRTFNRKTAYSCG